MSQPHLRITLSDRTERALPMQSASRHGNGFRMDFGGLPDVGVQGTHVVRQEFFDGERLVSESDRPVELPPNWQGHFLWTREQNQGQCSDDFEVFWAKVSRGRVTEQSVELVKKG